MDTSAILFWVILIPMLLLVVVVFVRFYRGIKGSQAAARVEGTAGRSPLSLDEFYVTYYAGKDVSKTACGQMLGVFSIATGVSSELLRPEDRIDSFGPPGGMRRQAAVIFGAEFDKAVAEARRLAEGAALPEKLVTLDDCIRAASVLERLHGKG